jgi:hypothetical protein
MESDGGLWDLPYYHGLVSFLVLLIFNLYFSFFKLPREDTVTLLKTNGEFLIRKSEENAGDVRTFVLSVVYGNVKHYLFREDKGRISIDFKSSKGYRSIREFVDSHMQSRQPVCSVLDIHMIKSFKQRSLFLGESCYYHKACRKSRLGTGTFKHCVWWKTWSWRIWHCTTR